MEYLFVLFLATAAVASPYGTWGQVSLVGPGTKETVLVGAAGKAILVPPKSSGYISTGITTGAVLKSGPAIVTPFLPAPVPEPIYGGYAGGYGGAAGYGGGYGGAAGYVGPIAGYGGVLDGGYGKGEALIKGPSGSISAGPGQALVVGPTGPNYGGYDGGYEGGYGGGYGGGYDGGYDGDDGDDGQYRGYGGKKYWYDWKIMLLTVG